MNRLSHHHSENLALRPRVMDDMLTLTEVPLAGVHLTARDNLVHAEILTRCFVSRYVVLIYVLAVRFLKCHQFSAGRKDTMPIIAGIGTFREIGEGLRGDGSMAMITSYSSQIFICILDRRQYPSV